MADIEFRSQSRASDFACKDGEIEGLGADNHFFNREEESLRPLRSVALEWGLVRERLGGWHLLADSFPAKPVLASEPSMEYWNEMAARVLGQFHSDATVAGQFVFPFMVTGAWRLTDGSYAWHTSPVTLTPNSGVPPVCTNGDITSTELEMKVAAAVCGLRFKMPLSEVLRDFTGVVESLDIFVSEPLLRYDSYHSCIPSRRVGSDIWCECIDPESGEIVRQRVSDVELPLAWKSNESWADTKDLNFRRFASVPLGELDRAFEWSDIERIGGTIYGFSGEQVKYSAIEARGAYPEKSVATVIEGFGEMIDVTTRPLKLGDAGKLKRVRCVRLRGSYNPRELTISVYGSRDMQKWWLLSKRKGGTMVMLPCSPFRFFKASFQGLLGEGETLQGLSVD